MQTLKIFVSEKIIWNRKTYNSTLNTKIRCIINYSMLEKLVDNILKACKLKL